MKVLLAVDDSKYSEAATRSVLVQANPSDTHVRVVNVIDALPNRLAETRAYYPGVEHENDALREPAEALVEKTAALLRSRGFYATGTVEWGSPKARIIEAASKWNADLIVIGSHGRTGLERFLMGSLAEAVAHEAPCSVEIVRIPSQQTAVQLAEDRSNRRAVAGKR